MGKIRSKVYDLLRLSERFFKTDMVYLAKGGFWFTVAQVFVSLSSFALAIAFAHFVSKEAYGQYKYVISIASLLGALTLTGLGSAVMRSVARGYDGTLLFAFWKSLRWSIGFFVVALGVAGYYFLNGNTLLGTSMIFVSALWPLLLGTNLYSPFLIAKKDFRRHALYFEIIGNLFPALCLLAVMLLGAETIWIIATYFAANALIGIVLFRKVLADYKPNNQVDPEAPGYAKHLSLINILSMIANNIDQILIFHYIGAAQLAIYNFATAIPNQTKGPLKGLSSLMFPKFVKRSDDEIESSMSYKFGTLLISGLIIAGVYIAAAPYIFHIFFPAYTESIFYSQIFALSLVSIIALPADTYLTAKKKVREQYLNNVLTSVSQIIILYVSITYWGLMGLVVGRVVGRIVSSIISIAMYRKVVSTSL